MNWFGRYDLINYVFIVGFFLGDLWDIFGDLFLGLNNNFLNFWGIGYKIYINFFFLEVKLKVKYFYL